MLTNASFVPRLPNLRRLILIGGLISTVTAAGRVAEAYQIPPDLKISIGAPSSVAAGAPVTYAVTVSNVINYGKPCLVIGCVTPKSGPAYNLSVNFSLPSGLAASSASGPGFICTLGATTTCSGGTVLAGATVTINVAAKAGSTSGTFTSTATVDPGNTITESDESNNGASHSLTVTPAPDLWAYHTVSPGMFSVYLPVTHTITVHNLGGGAASNIAIDMYTTQRASIVAWTGGTVTGGSGFSCNFPSNYGDRLQVKCTGGNLPPSATVTLTMTVKLVFDFMNPPAAGSPFTLFGYLDPQDAIFESNEGNNLFNATAYVQ
jgi:hypothetical protein